MRSEHARTPFAVLALARVSAIATFCDAITIKRCIYIYRRVGGCGCGCGVRRHSSRGD